MKTNSLILFLSLLFYSTINAEIETLGNFKNPKAVKEVLSGQRKTANAAWWGFDKKDSTLALQSAINSRASKVIVPYMDSDWIVRPIKLISDQQLLFEPGVTVVAKAGEFKSVAHCLFTAYHSKNIILKGYGVVFEMQKDDYLSDKYQQGQWRHAIKIIGCNNVTIQGLKLRKSGGDGIYLSQGTSTKNPPCTNILIEDCFLEDNYRQGITIISGAKIRINNCVFSGTSGHAPGAGIDLEPNYPNNILQDIIISNCTSKSNQGYGFVVALHKLSDKSKRVSILFYGCFISDCKMGASVRTSGKSSPVGLIEFRDCTFKDIKSTGLLLECRSQNFDVYFKNCKLSDICPTDYNSRMNYNVPIAIKAGEGNSAQIKFSNCYVYDDRDRNTVLVWPHESLGKNHCSINGNIYMKNSYSNSPIGDINRLATELNIEKIIN